MAASFSLRQLYDSLQHKLQLSTKVLSTLKYSRNKAKPFKKKEVHVPVHIIQQQLSEYMFSNSYYKVWYVKICKHKSEIASVRLAIDPKDGKLSSWSTSECSFEKLLTRYWHSQVKAHVLLCSPLPIHNVMQHFVTNAEKLQNEKQDETHTEKVVLDRYCASVSTHSLRYSIGEYDISVCVSLPMPII